VAGVGAGEDNAAVPGGTILVVDDEPDVRETLCETLEYEGYVAVQAANGRDALEYLRQNPAPCLVLLDLMMPVMNGYDFLEAIRNEPRLLPVSILIVSAAAREQIDAAAKSSGAVGVLAKPLQLKALLTAVEQYC
jgi:CheY-like chemotaxis protein